MPKAARKSAKQKPTIEQVFEAFMQFNSHVRGAIGHGNPGTWEREMQAARKAFKAKMEQFGLAEHIDWEVEK